MSLYSSSTFPLVLSTFGTIGTIYSIGTLVLLVPLIILGLLLLLGLLILLVLLVLYLCIYSVLGHLLAPVCRDAFALFQMVVILTTSDWKPPLSIAVDHQRCGQR